jgi:Spy/CpxP family protein refolding chaperone
MALVLTLAIAAFALTAQADSGYKEGGKGQKYGRHHGPGGGMGPGTAPGMGAGMRFMRALMAKLPQDKREQVRKINTDMQRQMIAKRSQIQIMGLDMRELMRAYPLDQAAVMAKMEAMQKMRREMFSLRLAAMAQVQEVAGKGFWDEAQASMGPGFGHGQRGHGAGRGWGPGMGRRPGAPGQPGRMAPPSGSHGNQGEMPKQ